MFAARIAILLGLLYAAVLAVPAQTTAPGVPGSLEGRVSNAVTGEPVGGASVHLYPLGRRRGQGALRPQIASSQSDGIFRFDSVPPANYFISAEASGFVSAGGRWRAKRIEITDGQQVTGVVIQLNPQGTISGKVLDENGRPEPGARVQAYTTFVVRGRLQLRRSRLASADKAGGYTLGRLNPGRYYISAELQPRSKISEAPQAESAVNAAEGSESIASGQPGFVRTFFPSALDVQSAAPLEVVAGQPTQRADITLRRAATYQIHGRVAQADGSLGRATVLLSPRDTLDVNVLGSSARVAPDGTFQVKNILPGSYTLWLLGSYSNEWGRRRHGGFRLLGRQDIDISASDIGGIVLALTPPVNLTGHVAADGVDSQRLSQLRVNFVPSGQVMLGNYQSAVVDAQGNFTVENLSPGQYAVRVNAPTGTYVQQVTYNRQDITTSGLDVSLGGGGEIDVTIAAGAAEVDGTVQVSDSNTAAAVVILVPDNVAPDGYGTLSAAVSDGRFAIRNVPPGRYYAYAAERWTSVWQSADFLREIQRSGTSVDVEQNGRSQIQLPLVTIDQVELTAARVGLTAQ